MAANLKRKKSAKSSQNDQLSLSSFFKNKSCSPSSSGSVQRESRKRLRGNDGPSKEGLALSPSKRISLEQHSSGDRSITKLESPDLGQEKSSSPPSEPATPLDQEQKQRMEQKKLEAEARRIAKRFGAGEIGISWIKALVDEFKKPYIEKLIDFVKEQRLHHVVYPAADDVFSWTLCCTIEEVKVVVLGQDPYHGPGQAHGMCFSVRVGVAPPPSLLNIYKELESDVESFTRPSHGYLMGWAKQGVLLLNACLTVRQKQPKSHSDKGWEKLTDAVVSWLNSRRKGLVFLLWGKDAHKKGSYIDTKKHKVLKSVHPSPLSAHRGFLGCHHFSMANQYLESVGKKPIDWNSLPEK